VSKKLRLAESPPAERVFTHLVARRNLITHRNYLTEQQPKMAVSQPTAPFGGVERHSGNLAVPNTDFVLWLLATAGQWVQDVDFPLLNSSIEKVLKLEWQS
jgi:hypothetical protein